MPLKVTDPERLSAPGVTRYSTTEHRPGPIPATPAAEDDVHVPAKLPMVISPVRTAGVERRAPCDIRCHAALVRYVLTMAKSPPKTAARKAPAARKPAGAKRAAAKTAAPKWTPGPEERYRMVQQAAYFIAEQNKFNGDPMDFWSAAEAQIARMLSGT